MTDDDDYYGLLGIAPTAGQDEIRRVWRQLALKWHPDHSRTDTAFIFQKLYIAYSTLSDPAARAAYDRQRESRVPSTPEAPSRRAPGVLIHRLSSPLNILMARGVARRGDDGVIELLLDADEVRDGGMAVISMPVLVRCTACSDARTGAACTRCNGSRAVEELFSAWLAVRPGLTHGTILKPSAQLPGVIQAVHFRARVP